METEKIEISKFRNFFLNLKEPCVLKRCLYQINTDQNKWTCITWTLEDWNNFLGNEKYKVQFNRICDREITSFNERKSKYEQNFCDDHSKRNKNAEPLNESSSTSAFLSADADWNREFVEPQWESSNVHGKMSFKEILKWNADSTAVYNEEKIENKAPLSSKNYWVYLNYFYMKDLDQQKDIDGRTFNANKDAISWDSFGLPEIKTEHSTLWVGTRGANTTCHYDTYGANIVCQILGKKRWTLFSKNESENLYATRIPYEESSVYSEVGFLSPDLDKFPKFRKTSPHMVVLEPGDVLLVPKHWWHFVECLDFSITINAWVPLKNDFVDRLKESLVLSQVSALTQNLSDIATLQNIFNPNNLEIATMSSKEVSEFLDTSLKTYIESSYMILSEAEIDDLALESGGTGEKLESGRTGEKLEREETGVKLEHGVTGEKLEIGGTGQKLENEKVSEKRKRKVEFESNGKDCKKVKIDYYEFQYVSKYTFEEYFFSVYGNDVDYSRPIIPLLPTDDKMSGNASVNSQSQHTDIYKTDKIEYSTDSEKPTERPSGRPTDNIVNVATSSIEHTKVLLKTFTDDRVLEVVLKVLNENLSK